MSTSYEDLLMDNGELVRIEYRDKYQDEFLDYLDNCIKRGDQLCVSVYDGTRAEYMGIQIERVNLKRMIARL